MPGVLLWNSCLRNPDPVPHLEKSDQIPLRNLLCDNISKSQDLLLHRAGMKPRSSIPGLGKKIEFSTHARRCWHGRKVVNSVPQLWVMSYTDVQVVLVWFRCELANRVPKFTSTSQ